MTDSKFRAVLTIFTSQKILELRFEGLNEEKTRIRSIPNEDCRCSINKEEFIRAFTNLICALNNYGKQVTGRYLIGKMLETT